MRSSDDGSAKVAFFRTIADDIRASVDPKRRSGLDYWTRLVGKLLFAPSVQVVVLYRFGSAMYRRPITRPIAYILRSISVVWGGTEIHPAATIGPGFCLVHSQKVVIGRGVAIGRDVRISHGVSIGGDLGRGLESDSPGSPVIGDHVTIALDSIVLGPVTIGDFAVISAQSLVVRDVPAHTLAAGSPARAVRRLDSESTVTSS